MGAAITGIGKALPPRVVTNQEIEARLGLDAGWIESRTGILERRVAAPGESASTLGADAGRTAMEVAGVDAADIELVVTATCTGDHQFPSTASLIQDRLGLPRAGAFDLNAACSGFVYALAAASSMMDGMGVEAALVIGVDVLSRFTNHDDPITAPLFGDGAGAAVLKRSEDALPMRFLLGSDGGGAEHVMVRAGGSRLPASHDTVEKSMHTIRMAGREVYRNAVTRMTELGRELGAGGFESVIAHQANRRIIDECARKLGIDASDVYLNIARYGNTSAASIPIAMCEAWEEGALKQGDRLMLLAFGAGFSWGGALVPWTLPGRADPAVEVLDKEAVG